MLPIKDLTKTLTKPHINRLLLITNIIIFLLFWLSYNNIIIGDQFARFIDQNFVMYPFQVLDGLRLYTLFTSMFMHGGWLHLLGNMLFLYVFGDNIEDVFGHVGYLIFYLISGLAAAFTEILVTLYAPSINIFFGFIIPSDLTIGVVGASGAISGILGAYLVLYPRSQILSIVIYFILPVPAILFLGFWFIMQWLFGVFDPSGGVAYFAHIGGFITGMIIALTIGLERKRQLKERFHL